MHQYYLANRGALLTYRHRYQQEHRDERAEKAHQYNQEHKAELAAYHRKYWEEHPEICRISSARRRALLLEAEGTFTVDEWLQVLEDFDYCCAYCGVQLDAPTMDHVVPLSKGGTNDIDNIVPACKSCNSRKRDRDLNEFLKEV
jgi:5-methylcytosine-specific restriction endonuclease McrA